MPMLARAKFLFPMWAALASSAVAGAVTATPALADGPEEAPSNPARKAVEDDPYATNAMACRGRAELLAKDVDPSQIEREIVKKLQDAARPEETPAQTADDYCIAAELSWRIGSADAPEYYRRAIGLAPLDPGYEYLFGHYYRWLRGANSPVLEQAEGHFYAALRKLEALRTRGVHRDQDATVADWMQRDMQELYQSDGLPLLRAKAYPYGGSGLDLPGVSAIGRFQYSQDTTDFWHMNEDRAFTTEALFSASSQRLGRPLTQQELYSLIINPLRVDYAAKLRVRFNWLGALDVGYDYFYSPNSQITSFFQPGVYNDINVKTLSIGYGRTFDLYPLFDANVSLQYQWISRTGFVEFLPQLTENFPTYLGSVTLARKLGPDVLSLNLAYVYMDIPYYTTGLIDERKRQEVIRAATVDYAMYRSFVLPGADRRSYTRGWHWFGGVADDQGVWGTRLVEKDDVFVGTSLLGVGRGGLNDVTLQGTYASAQTIDSRYGLDPEQSNGHVRTNLTLAHRLVDDQAPGVIAPVAGIFYPANLTFVLPAAWDTTTQAINTYENFRVGGELWYRDADPVLSSEFLVTAGYSYQYFYNMKRQVNDVHVDVRLGGW